MAEPGDAAATGSSSPDLPVVVVTSADGAPDGAVVERLYLSAASAPPLRESPATAALFTRVYMASLREAGLRVACCWDGDQLVGFAYGHDWRWADQDYGWAHELRECLAPEAAEVAEGAFVLSLFAVHPDAQRRGLGRRLLRAVLPPTGTAWLVTTDVDSPARALYAAEGWTPLGYGPKAPDGRLGLVLVLVR